MNILYFEPEESQSLFLKEGLDTLYNHEVIHCSSISEFLEEIYSKQSLDVCILACRCPLGELYKLPTLKEQFTVTQLEGMNEGWDVGEILFEKLREIELYKTLPVLFYTSKPKVRVKGDHFSVLRKPETLNYLERYLRMLRENS